MSWEEELERMRIARQGIGGPEKSNLYSDSSEMGFQSQPDFGAAKYSSKIADQGMKGEQAILNAGTAASVPFMATPAGAAVAVGSQLLQGYLSQKAQAEQAKRQREMEIAQQHSQGERQGIDQMLGAWRNALR